jgi:hypothetical protein
VQLQLQWRKSRRGKGSVHTAYGEPGKEKEKTERAKHNTREKGKSQVHFIFIHSLTVQFAVQGGRKTRKERSYGKGKNNEYGNWDYLLTFPLTFNSDLGIWIAISRIHLVKIQDEFYTA